MTCSNFLRLTLAVILFFVSSHSVGQKYKISASAGLIHNTVFSDPTLELDTVFSIYGVEGEKVFPSSGYLIGAEIEKKIFTDDVSIKLGIEYSHFVLISKIDSGTARFLQSYFINPFIESRITSNCFSIPTYITYTYEKLSLDAGISIRVLKWGGQKAFLLNGESTEVSPKFTKSEIYASFIAKLNILMTNMLSCSIGYSPYYKPMIGSKMLYFGLKYTFKTF